MNKKIIHGSNHTHNDLKKKYQPNKNNTKNQNKSLIKQTKTKTTNAKSNPPPKKKAQRHSRSGRGVAIPLAAILEPVGHLRQSEARLLRQAPLLVWRRVPVLLVALLEGDSRLLLEAVDGLLAVPDRLGQRVFLPDAVLVHGSCRRRGRRGGGGEWIRT